MDTTAQRTADLTARQAEAEARAADLAGAKDAKKKAAQVPPIAGPAFLREG